jgi:tetratricopeptide (TPR) repeat protein
MKAYIPALIIILSLLPFFDTIAAENDYFRKAMQHYSRKEFELAAASFEEAKNIEPRNGDIYFYLGNSYWELGELDDAILSYTAGLSFTDQKGRFFYNLGNCYYVKGNYSFAADMYAKAVERDPGIVGAYRDAGMAYYKLGRYEDTINQWETYLNVYPETDQYAEIEKAIAILRRKTTGKGTETEDNNALLDEVLGDLDSLVGKTENIMEGSEKPVDDLTVEGIER